MRAPLSKARIHFALEELGEVGSASQLNAFEKPCLVGTFHKTGTTLIWHVLEDFARYANFKLWNIGMHPDDSDDWLLGFDWWSDFHQAGVDPEQYATAAIVRDPRNVVVSSMKFHCRSMEPWLHVPLDELDGRTYQEALLALDGDEERYIFEIEHQSGREIEQMLDWSFDRPEFLELRYDQLVGHKAEDNFARAIADWPFPRPERELLVRLFRYFSLGSPGAKGNKHIRNAAAGQWRDAFTPRVRAAFDDRLPGAARKLGYGPDGEALR